MSRDSFTNDSNPACPSPHCQVLCLSVTLMSLVPASLNWAQGGKTEVFPVQKLHRRRSLSRRPEVKWSYGVNCGSKTGCLELSSDTSVIRFSVAPTGSWVYHPKLLGLACDHAESGSFVGTDASRLQCLRDP